MTSDTKKPTGFEEAPQAELTGTPMSGSVSDWAEEVCREAAKPKAKPAKASAKKAPAKKAPNKNRQRAQKYGRRAEWFAALSLQLKGYRIISRGFKTKMGEIDIIARKGNLVAFIEVKARANVASAIDAVTQSSKRRIANAADIWLAGQKDFAKLSRRFDIIAVVPKKWPVHFPDAF